MNVTHLTALRLDCDAAIEIAATAATTLGTNEKFVFDYAIDEFADRYGSIDNRRFDNVTAQTVFELCARYHLPLAPAELHEALVDRYADNVKPILNALRVVHNYLVRTWSSAPDSLPASVVEAARAQHIEHTIPDLFAAKLTEYCAE